MLSTISKYMPRWLMGIIATALVLATVVGSNQGSAEAIDPADPDTVYIADGTSFPDALMGATVAALNTSPMLGVAGTNGGDTIPGDTADELDRLTNNKRDPLDTIYIFGGAAAVSDKVKADLGAWATDVKRIEGDSRWGTMKAISEALPAKVKDSDLLDGMDSKEFATKDQLTQHWVASGSSRSVKTGSGTTAGTAAAVCSTVDVPADGFLMIEGQIVLDNQSPDPVQVVEDQFSGAMTQLPPDGDTGNIATMPVSTFTEVAADDDGTYCLNLSVTDHTGDSDTETVDLQGTMHITFVQFGAVSSSAEQVG